MSCKAYKNALKNVVEVDALLDADIQTHLNNCPDCRLVLAESQLLTAAVDEGVRHVVNASPSPAFFLRIQKQILQIQNENAATRPRSIGWRLALLPIAAALLFALAPFVGRQSRVLSGRLPRNSPVAAGVSELGVMPPDVPTRGRWKTTRSTEIRREKITQTAVVLGNPEILVSSEEQDSLLLLLGVIHKNAEAAKELAAPTISKDLNALQVAPLQIARLHLEPLETQSFNPSESDGSR